MNTINNDTNEIEARIIKAANHVFMKYGVGTATMGQIADEAGINRTSLNYYFRSKKHLLQNVLNNLENRIIPTISRLINDDRLAITDKIELFVDEYMDLVAKYPMVPAFILSELTRQPDWIIQFIKRRNLNFEKLTQQIAEEAAQGKVYPIKLEDLFVNIFGLCVFPLLSKPLILEFFFDHNEDQLTEFMTSRKSEVKRIIRNWLKPE